MPTGVIAMITASSSVEIDRPVSEVYAFVSDCRNEPKWHTDAIEAGLLGEGPLAVGAKQRWLIKFMGKREMIMEVTRLEPERVEVLEARTALMGMAPTITYSFEQAGSGTRFTRSVTMDPKGIGALMKPMMRSMVPKQNAGFVRKLKQVFES
jgi:polyketide cyclase/dehydrase/lipid transport protein